MLSVIYAEYRKLALYAVCHCAEGRNAEPHYDQSHYAVC
jgi:hypothetical protein